MFDIHEELKKLPKKPGVYIMKNKKEDVIYVGKAINLKNRVRQYFQLSGQKDPKNMSMVPKIRSFEYIVVDNEVEALVLECTLIKKHKPRYNVVMKDDKSYPYIKITVNEDFPRIFMTRNLYKDNAKYLGPYTSKYAIEEAIEVLHKVWPLRRCRKSIKDGVTKDRPCLNYHIGQCLAPCNGLISKEDYLKILDEAIGFLNGKQPEVLRDLENKMNEASERMDYEEAAEYRDKAMAIKKLEEKQKIESASGEDQDIIGLAKTDTEALAHIFFIRNGKMIGRDSFMLDGVEELKRSDILTEFISQYYSGTPYIPKEIIVECPINDKETINKWLNMQKGQKVAITVPQRGKKLRLVQLSNKNANLVLSQFGEQLARKKKRTEGAIEEIRKALELDFPLKRIEAYDISNIQGYESVGSMIVFENGSPKRNDYRKFKIKTIIGPDDYGSMEEVIERRFNRYFKEKEKRLDEAGYVGKFSSLPSIIFIDGGKGQVSVAKRKIESLGLNIPVCGMVKDDRHRTEGLLFEGEEVYLPKNSEGFKLVTRIQDEAHRFAIEFHRKLRSKSQVRSILDDINGIGKTRRKALLKYYGSIDKIQKAPVEEMRKIPSMDIRSAKAVYNFFNK